MVKLGRNVSLSTESLSLGSFRLVCVARGPPLGQPVCHARLGLSLTSQELGDPGLFPDCWGWTQGREGVCPRPSSWAPVPSGLRLPGSAHPHAGPAGDGVSHPWPGSGRSQMAMLCSWSCPSEHAGRVPSARGARRPCLEWGALPAFPVQVQFSVAASVGGLPSPPGLCARRGAFSMKPLHPCSHGSCHSPSGGLWSWIRTDRC